MAEAILNFKGRPRFTAYSAGSHPSGKLRPEALKQLQSAGLPVEGLRSKSWDEFSQPGAPHLDFIFTVCDNAAKEACPLYCHASNPANGGTPQPFVAHWGVPDPAAVQGSEQEIERAFREAYTILDRRISLFLSLALDSVDPLALKSEIAKIGQK